MVRSLIASLNVFAVAAGADITLESFDAPVHKWVSQNDPVMGGKSTSTFTISDGIGSMNGTCAIVPSLNAPGFIKAQTSGKFPDVSSCQGLTLTTRSASTPANYEGYRVSFGSDSAFLQCGKFFARGFKADFTAGEGEFKTVQVPFDMFTKCWDDSTGDAVKTCKDSPQFCPTESRLKDLQSLTFWAEGKEADVKLDIKNIGAYGCSALKAESEVKLATFDGLKETSLSWRKTLDPVMGGASTGEFKITDAGTGKFSGTCNIVRSLQAPGFAKIDGTGRTLADVTGADSLLLKVKSSTPDYQGFKVAFGAPGIPRTSIFVAGSYKTEFYLSDTTDWQIVQVPLTNFSRDTSDYTGRCDTKDPRTGGKQHYCCSASPLTPSKDEVCVESKYLSSINSLAIWAEGVEGDFDLEIEWIGANPSTVVV